MRIVKHIENERGMALVTTMLFLVILFFLGVAAYMMTSSDLRISGYYRQSQEAFYVAESGIEDARGRMRAIYMDQILGASPGVTWRYYIGSSALAAELNSNYSSHTSVGKLGDDMDYAVELRLKTGADPNSGSGIGSSDIIYWNGSTETAGSSGSRSYPIFIATSLGAKGDARKKIIAEIRGTSIFAPAPAALYVNGDLTKNGVSGSASGAWGSWWPGSTCPAVPDIMTTVNATTTDAEDWPAQTSADGPMPNHPQKPPQPPTPTDPDDMEEWLEVGVPEDYYPIEDVMAMAYSECDQFVTGSTPTPYGTETSPVIYYSDGNLSVNNLNGYGILAVDGNLTLGGNIEWHGLIVVTGQSVFNGGGVQQIYGAMISGSVATVNGQPDFLYDCTYLSTLEARSPKFQVYSWKEDL